MAITKKDIEQTQYKYESIQDCLSEKGRRIWAAVEATAYGRGGIKLICEATGISTATIYKGIRELRDGKSHTGRIRKNGGGRKSHELTQPGILEALDKLVDSTSKGDPENPLKWTSKSVRRLAQKP